MSCIPQNEMIVLAGDMNGHVGSSKLVMLTLMGCMVVLGMEIGMQMSLQMG